MTDSSENPSDDNTSTPSESPFQYWDGREKYTDKASRSYQARASFELESDASAGWREGCEFLGHEPPEEQMHPDTVVAYYDQGADEQQWKRSRGVTS
jgi:hypothetical protein